MNVFTFVFLVVVVFAVTQVAETWIKQRDKRAKGGEELTETLEKMMALEERIRVLERIVTENRVDLKQQIDSL